MLCPCTTLVWSGTGSFVAEGFGVIPLSSIDLMSFVFLPLTPTTGVFDCFCVCTVWLQFAFCKKKYTDQEVRLAALSWLPCSWYLSKLCSEIDLSVSTTLHSTTYLPWSKPESSSHTLSVTCAAGHNPLCLSYCLCSRGRSSPIPQPVPAG